MSLIIDIVLWFIVGYWFGRAAYLMVSAHRRATRARTNMLGAMTYVPRPLDPEWDSWPLVEGPRSQERILAVRKNRQLASAKAYAQARQDRRRALAWPIFDLRAHRQRNRQANDILHAVIAEQTVKALHDLQERTKEVA